jgi:eukaryotic-like serine/threonine-protein kinase
MVASTERYRLLEPIARSWSGVVYRALDVRADRQVALKHFDVGPAPSLERRTRFRHELEVLAAGPIHPGLVRVLDQGDEESQPYVVLELLEGARSFSVAAPLSIDAAVQVGLAVGRALQHAHGLGVAHKALGLDALLVVPGQPLAPRLTGFGLASIESGAATENDRAPSSSSSTT